MSSSRLKAEKYRIRNQALQRLLLIQIVVVRYFIKMKQCKDFEVASENSDAECFVDTHEESELLLNYKH